MFASREVDGLTVPAIIISLVACTKSSRQVLLVPLELLRSVASLPSTPLTTATPWKGAVFDLAEKLPTLITGVPFWMGPLQPA